MLLDRIIRAWKDPEFRQSLSEEEQAALPENPAGAIELTDDELETVTGGHGPSYAPQRSYSSNASRSYSNSSNSASQSYSSNSNSARRPNSNSMRRPYSNSNNSSRSYSSNSNSASNSNSRRSSQSYAWRRPR